MYPKAPKKEHSVGLMLRLGAMQCLGKPLCRGLGGGRKFASVQMSSIAWRYEKETEDRGAMKRKPFKELHLMAVPPMDNNN